MSSLQRSVAFNTGTSPRSPATCIDLISFLIVSRQATAVARPQYNPPEGGSQPALTPLIARDRSSRDKGQHKPATVATFPPAPQGPVGCSCLMPAAIQC